MKGKTLLLGLLLLLILHATACGTSPKPTNMPTLTNTPTLTKTPTLTNTPAPANTPEPFVRVEPDPDTVWHPHEVTFIGPLEMSIPGRNATAGQGRLELTIRRDGMAIVFLRYSLLHATCSDDSGTIRRENYGWTLSTSLPGPAFIVNGMFEFNYPENGLKVVSGHFTSPTEAIAMVEISTEEGIATGDSFICDFGTWIWSGEVK